MRGAMGGESNAVKMFGLRGWWGSLDQRALFRKKREGSLVI